MTFNVKIVMQPFEVSFEAGSIAEAVSILSDPENEIAKLAALATDTGDDEPQEPAITASEAPTTAEPKKRGRKAKAPVEAVAPAPLPVPSTPAAPVNTTPGASGIPAFLDRTAQAPAPVAIAPPPPVAPAPVVAAPPPPPVGVLGPKVIAELNRRKEGQSDGGAGLIAWVASAGLIVPSATWDEMTACLQFLDDAKLGPVAGGLGVA